MSSRELEPAMLIVSRAIYAKRVDETFYPGRIETKLPDGSYLVKFADGCSERIEESCITWLGFWGLPPWTWPSNPLVQPASSANWEVFNEHTRYTSTKDYRPLSRPLRTQEKSNERVKPVNKFLHQGSKPEVADGMKIGNGDSQELNSFRKNSEDTMPKHTSLNQTRTSVIRICPNSHLKQEDEDTKNTFTKQSLQFTDTTPSPNRTCSPSSNEENKEVSFNGHEIFFQENESLVRKRKVSSSEEVLIKEKHFRSENNLRNSLPFNENFPLSTSIPLPSSHHENYSQPFRFSMYEPSSNPTPASFRLQTKARRRSENKKCRKVYGIENRNIWCTQCKWKKACSRFSGMEKDDLGGFMYMADYDDLHFPVVS